MNDDFEKQIAHAREVKIHDILGLKQSNRRISVRCVFHSDNTPSLCIYPNGGYHCFGCGKTGQNSIDFVIALGYDFKGAIKELMDY